MTVKDIVIDMIRRLPDNVSIADIMEELYFRQKVDQGLRELDQGQGVPHDEARDQLKKWLA